jgi:hypothetical protein
MNGHWTWWDDADRETPHCAILFTTYPAWTGVVLNLGLSDEKGDYLPELWHE